MHLKELRLINFKNYDELSLNFTSKINCFTGRNGIGKTNLLDAIFYLSMCKSYLNPIDSHNIRFNEDFFVIQGAYERKGKREDIYCGMKRNRKKKFTRNDKEYPRLSDHIGLLPVVMVSPYDSALILEGSEERRKFMNSVISQYDHPYLENVIRFNKALQQRNKLLKDFYKAGSFDRNMLELWDEQLIQYGQPVYQKRKEFADDLVPVFQKYYSAVSRDHEKVELTYDSPLHGQDYRQLLNESVEKDRILQYTSVGIHKDDLIFSLSGYPVKKMGSQGQQKTFLVALKMAQFEFLRKISGLTPILLLDDIFDKFDKERVEEIIRLVSDEQFGQIFITDTNPQRLREIIKKVDIEHAVFHLKGNGDMEIELERI